MASVGCSPHRTKPSLDVACWQPQERPWQVAESDRYFQFAKSALTIVVGLGALALLNDDVRRKA